MGTTKGMSPALTETALVGRRSLSVLIKLLGTVADITSAHRSVFKLYSALAHTYCIALIELHITRATYLPFIKKDPFAMTKINETNLRRLSTHTHSTLRYISVWNK